MRSRTTGIALAALLLPACFPPGASGPGFRWAPETIRGVDWSARVSKLHATLTVVDSLHGTRVYVVHLPELHVAEFYLPSVQALDACAVPGRDDAYVLLKDGRIVRAAQDLEAPPVFRGKGTIDLGSTIALSPDGSTIALLSHPGNYDWDPTKSFHLTLVGTSGGPSADLRGEFNGNRVCWAADGKSLFLGETMGDIVQQPLAATEPVRRIGSGAWPFLSQDGRSLLFEPSTLPSREWNGVDWVHSCMLMRWEVGSPESPAELPSQIPTTGWVLAISDDGCVVHQSGADERLPLEHSGFLLRGPYWRGGISVTDPAQGTVEPLFVGTAPNSIQWRWD